MISIVVINSRNENFADFRDLKKKSKLGRSGLILLQSPLHKTCTMKFCIEDFFSKCDQIRSILRIFYALHWLYTLQSYIAGNFQVANSH